MATRLLGCVLMTGGRRSRGLATLDSMTRKRRSNVECGSFFTCLIFLFQSPSWLSAIFKEEEECCVVLCARFRDSCGKLLPTVWQQLCNSWNGSPRFPVVQVDGFSRQLSLYSFSCSLELSWASITRRILFWHQGRNGACWYTGLVFIRSAKKQRIRHRRHIGNSWYSQQWS